MAPRVVEKRQLLEAKWPQLLSIGSSTPPVIERRFGQAYTRSLLHGNGLTRTPREMGRVVNLRGRWWLSELGVGVQVRGGTCALTTRLRLEDAA